MQLNSNLTFRGTFVQNNANLNKMDNQNKAKLIKEAFEDASYLVNSKRISRQEGPAFIVDNKDDKQVKKFISKEIGNENWGKYIIYEA